MSLMCIAGGGVFLISFMCVLLMEVVAHEKERAIKVILATRRLIEVIDVECRTHVPASIVHEAYAAFKAVKEYEAEDK
jgi:hypothetical protein